MDARLPYDAQAILSSLHKNNQSPNNRLINASPILKKVSDVVTHSAPEVRRMGGSGSSGEGKPSSSISGSVQAQQSNSPNLSHLLELGESHDADSISSADSSERESGAGNNADGENGSSDRESGKDGMQAIPSSAGIHELERRSSLVVRERDTVSLLGSFETALGEKKEEGERENRRGSLHRLSDGDVLGDDLERSNTPDKGDEDGKDGGDDLIEMIDKARDDGEKGSVWGRLSVAFVSDEGVLWAREMFISLQEESRQQRASLLTTRSLKGVASEEKGHSRKASRGGVSLPLSTTSGTLAGTSTGSISSSVGGGSSSISYSSGGGNSNSSSIIGGGSGGNGIGLGLERTWKIMAEDFAGEYSFRNSITERMRETGAQVSCI